MYKKEFDLYSKILLNISNDNFNDINTIIEKIEGVIPFIRIYIFKLDNNNRIYKYHCNENRNIKRFCKNNILRTDRNKVEKLISKLNSENKIYFNNLNYIKQNYYYEYQVLKNENIESIAIYPLRLFDEVNAFIYIDSTDKIETIKNVIELLADLINNHIEKSHDKSNNTHNDINKFYKEVKNGIKRNEFKFVYQPKFNLKSGHLIGAEALIRWHKSAEVIIYPDSFVEKLENNNLIYLIDYYTIEECLKKLYYWNNTYKNNIVPISINLSKSTLMRNDFISTLEVLIAMYNVDLKYLEFEITEREYVDYGIKDINNRIEKVRSLGIKISLDDFGTGNSNLSFSMNIDLDTIKVDRSLINKIGENEKINYLLEFIIDLANKNNINLVAEGIETEEQIEFLIDSGYKFGQGYYFSKPIDAELFEKKYLNI